MTFGGTFLRLANAGVFALIALPRATDRDLINPLATWPPRRRSPTSRNAAEQTGLIASAVQPRGQETLDFSECCCGARALQASRAGRASDGPAGRRGTNSGGHPSFQERPARTPLLCGGVDGRDPGHIVGGSDADPLIPPPRTRCGRGLRTAVALESRNWPPDRPVNARVLGAPQRRPFAGMPEGIAFRWGSKWGSPGEHRAVRFGHEPRL